MTKENWIAIAQIAVSVVSAPAAAWLAVRWSLRRFRSEKWWELQCETYKRLLENLAITKHCVGQKLHYAQHPEVMLGPSEMLEGQLPQAMAELHKAAAVGPIYISEVASDALADLSKAFSIDLGEGANGDFPRYLEAVNRCLSVVRKEAEHAKDSTLK